ncbi:DUF2798 domain-containing protein [Candidatus Bathyarchaeota archaeon]|nr:DUF2798 domain-containing protein [Candidatus Bathyarchaeota archaeon]
MGLSLSLIMSFTMTVVFIGFTPMFLTAWIQGFLMGTVVSIPASLIFGPLVSRVVRYLISDLDQLAFIQSIESAQDFP